GRASAPGPRGRISLRGPPRRGRARSVLVFRPAAIIAPEVRGRDTAQIGHRGVALSPALAAKGEGSWMSVSWSPPRVFAAPFLPFFLFLGFMTLMAAASMVVLMWGGVILLDHLDAGAAVLGYLVDVGAFEEAETDVGVAKAVSRARLAFAVGLEVLLGEDGVEELVVVNGAVD